MTVSGVQLELLVENADALVVDYLRLDPEMHGELGRAIADLIAGERLTWSLEDWENEIDVLAREERLTVGDLLVRFGETEV